MSARPHRRYRLVVALLGTLLAVGLLSSCSGQRDPSSYTSGVKEQIVLGCVDQGKKDQKEPGAETKDFWTTSECTCAKDRIVKQVPFGTFKDIENAQINEPTPLPKSFTKVFESCNK